MARKTDNDIVLACDEISRDFGLTRTHKLSWRDEASGGFRSFFLEKSQWQQPSKYYANIAFYPMEHLQKDRLRRKDPLPENYPIKFRLNAAARIRGWTKPFDHLFLLDEDLSFDERKNELSYVLANMILPIFSRLTSSISVRTLCEEYSELKCYVGMPALGLIDDQMSFLLSDYEFSNGELKYAGD
ncbi:MAG: hypothetical protein ABJH45_22640 [Paracoccaceae bacterium]